VGEPIASVPDEPERTGTFVAGETAAESQVASWPAVAGYQVLGELGSGGMGVVYLAQQVSLNRLVALKMIRAGSQARPEDRERFRAEALAVARLQHPNIVQIHEVGEYQGQPFLALEYAEGGSLSQHLAATPQPADQAAALVEVVARAMHHAHTRGIVHRDLKPANVLLQKQWDKPGGFSGSLRISGVQTQPEQKEQAGTVGRAGPDPTPLVGASASLGRPAEGGPDSGASGSWAAKVSDFGLAKLLDDDSGQTRTGTVLGTPSYMAPEQASGKRNAIGAVTDVYALGAILYEMLTGRPPFKAATPFDTVFQVLHEEAVPPRLLQPKVPRDLETICVKCLQKDPGKRYATALALAEDLRRFQAHEPISARPVGRLERLARWCRRHPGEAILAASLGIVLLAVAVVAVVFAAYYSDLAVREKARAEESRERLVRLHSDGGLRLVNEGDLLGAVLPFALALREEQDDPGPQELHRARLGTVLQQCPRLLRAWPYDGVVVSAGFSPDGRRVLLAGVRSTASHDGAAARSEGDGIIWNVETGEEVRCSGPQVGQVRAGRMALDRLGSQIARISSDGTVELCKIANGKSLGPMKHPRVNLLVFSPDGGSLLTASSDGTVRIWDTATGCEACPPLAHDNEVWDASFSLDGHRIVTASKDRQARVWDARTGERQLTLEHADSVNHASFSPDGSYLLTITLRAEARVWDAASGKPVTALLSDRDQLTPGGWSPERSPLRVVTIGRNSVPLVWEVPTGKPVAPASVFRGGITRATFAPDGRWLVTAGLDGMARVLDATTGRPTTPPLLHAAAVQHAAFAPDGRRVLTVSLDGVVRVWDLAAADPVSVPLRLSGAPPTESLYLTGERVVALSPDGRRQAWTRWPDHAARIVDTATGRETAGPLGHAGWIGQLSFSADGRLLATASADKTARIWDAATGAPLATPLQHTEQVRHVSFDPAGRRVVTASMDKTARVWDVAKGSPLTEPLVHARTVDYAAFAPDGRRLVTVSSMEVQVWDVDTGQRIGAAIAHRGLVAHAALSPDGRYVATGTRDGAACIWEVETGRAMIPPLQHQRTIDHVCFSPDGRLFATASLDGTARVWMTASGEALTPLLRHGFPGKLHVAFTPEGRRLVLTGDAEQALVWDLAPEAVDPAEMVAFAELLTGQQLGGQQLASQLDLGRQAAHWHQTWRDFRARWPERFSTSLPQVVAFHRRLADDAQKAGAWFAVRWHAERLVALQPQDGPAWATLAAAHAALHKWDEAAHAYTKAIERGAYPASVWYRRGLVHAEQGAWDRAAADLQEAVSHGMADWDMWYELAVVRLAAGDDKGYRTACASLRERFGKSADVYNDNTLAWTCVLAPGGTDDPAWAVRLAQERVGTDPKGPGWTNAHLNTLGASLYRAGRFAEAIDRLKQAIEAGRGQGIPEDWLFLAMAHARLGHDEEARQCLKRATQRIEQALKPNAPPQPWTTLVEHRVLLLEANRVVNGISPPMPGGTHDGERLR
jgi:WD40 repeat protein/serine/threonine protein kinase/tetratricopeptide (TPR) repeat protein